MMPEPDGCACKAADGSGAVWWLRRRSEGYLYWHPYKTQEARDRWARVYSERGDAIWMNEDGSQDGLYFLRDEEMTHV